jgi:hypothetical protein
VSEVNGGENGPYMFRDVAKIVEVESLRSVILEIVEPDALQDRYNNKIIFSPGDILRGEIHFDVSLLETAQGGDLVLVSRGSGITMDTSREPRTFWSNGIGPYTNIPPELTLDQVRALAAKGGALQAFDLPNLRPSLLNSTMGGYNPTLCGIEGGYRLSISFNGTTNPDSGIKATSLESIWENGWSGIDIRYSDVDEFIRKHPSRPADEVEFLGNPQIKSDGIESIVINATLSGDEEREESLLGVYKTHCRPCILLS